MTVKKERKIEGCAECSLNMTKKETKPWKNILMPSDSPSLLWGLGPSLVIVLSAALEVFIDLTGDKE